MGVNGALSGHAGALKAFTNGLPEWSACCRTPSDVRCCAWFGWVRGRVVHGRAPRAGLPYLLNGGQQPARVVLGGIILRKKSRNTFRVGIFLDFVWLTARTMHPHGEYVRGARRNRIDRHGVGLNGSGRSPPSCSIET